MVRVRYRRVSVVRGRVSFFVSPPLPQERGDHHTSLLWFEPVGCEHLRCLVWLMQTDECFWVSRGTIRLTATIAFPRPKGIHRWCCSLHFTARPLLSLCDGPAHCVEWTGPTRHLVDLLKPCCCLRAQSCPTLCGPMDGSPPGSSVHRIFPARIQE